MRNRACVLYHVIQQLFAVSSAVSDPAVLASPTEPSVAICCFVFNDASGDERLGSD